MKTTPAAASRLALLAALGASLLGCPKARVETVSASTIAALPPGQTFDVDLTRGGTVYQFAGDADFGRVSLRTATGARSFGELLKESNTSVRGGVVLGTPDDMRDHFPPATGTTTNFDCGVFCKCNDTVDCLDMIVQGKCGGEIWCSSDTPSCFCVAKA
jgi:hypothetical protein